jgi:crotonobetainyl-CoA:carnitine CoA-transferase CaiB-like acyl-CoA transferase
MHGVDLHGSAAASVPVSLLANPAHFPRTPIVHEHPPPAPVAHTAEVLRQLLDGSEMELSRLQQNGCV